MDPISRIAKDLNIVIKPLNSENASKIADKVIKALAERNHLNIRNLTPLIDQSHSIFDLGASAGSDIVYLPPLYFIDRKDVPFTGPEDKTLKDDKKLQEFADSVAKKLRLQHKKITAEDRMHLRMYLEASQDPEKAKDTISFIILHELGHIHKGHSKRKADYQEKLEKPKYQIINLLTLGIFKKAAMDLQSRKHEKEADAFAYSTSSKNAEGGAHLFKVIRKLKPKGTLEKISFAAFHIFTLPSHGTYRSREKRVKDHIRKSNPPM